MRKLGFLAVTVTCASYIFHGLYKRYSIIELCGVKLVFEYFDKVPSNICK